MLCLVFLILVSLILALVVPTLPVVAFVVYDAVGPVLTCFALCNPLSFLPTLLSDPSIAPGYP